MTGKRNLVRALTAAFAAVAVAACGSDDGTPASTPGGLTTVTVGVQPITPFAVVPLGVQKGLFRKRGLDVKVQTITTATTIPPALLNGQLQFSDWSFASFTTLADKKLPLAIVGPGDTAGSDLTTDYTQLVTLKSSGITSVKQLEGKTIAVNSLASLSEAQTRAALRKAGVDPKAVKLVPIPYPDQGAALTGKRVDAAQTAEPFLTKLQQSPGVNQLAALDATVMPDLPVSTWMTSRRYVAEHRDIVRAFQLGLRDSLEYAQQHPEAVREFIPQFAGVDAAVADKMILPTWVTSVDAAKVQRVADFMASAGIVSRAPAMKDHMLPFPLPEQD